MEDRRVNGGQIKNVPVSLLPQTADELLKGLGLLTWLAYAPLAWLNAFSGETYAGLQSLKPFGLFVWTLAYLTFGIALVRLMWCKDDRESLRFRVVLTSLITLAVLSMSWVFPQPWPRGFFLSGRHLRGLCYKTLPL
jgi:hypothetical protein